MTGDKCLLDTSIVIHSFKSDHVIGERLDNIVEIYVPLIVVGELYYGAYRSGSAEKHIERIEAFLRNCKLLQVDFTTATTYGNIKAALTMKGKPIPENDIWIAATAIQYQLPLYTTDKHFSEIEGLSLL
jgi:tRNA(fMet)-specific endonuclease VapC